MYIYIFTYIYSLRKSNNYSLKSAQHNIYIYISINTVMNINIYILVSEILSNFFLCENYKNFGGIKFGRLGHFEYFLKPFLYIFSQNPRNQRKLILLRYIVFLIF